MIAGFLGAGIGTWVMMAFNAPAWVPLLAALPALPLAVALIRPLKGVLVVLQYHYRSGDSGLGDFGDSAPAVPPAAETAVPDSVTRSKARPQAQPQD